MSENIPFLSKSYERVRTSSKSLVQRLMPVLAFLIIFSSISVALLLYTQHRHYLYDQFKDNIAQTRNDMHVLVQQQTSALSMSLKTVVNDPSVQRSLRLGDSEALLDQWQDVFQKMKLENRLTHLYFMDKNRVVILRVHKPSKKGDIIDRFTTQEAEWSRKLSAGIEVGPMGMLTLRVVQPVIIDNELIGYVEMGKEIEDILQVLHLSEDIELAMALRKDVVKRPDWEEGMRLMGREPNWKLFANDVLIYSSLEHLPSAMIEHIDKDLAFRHMHENGSDEISAEGNTYRAAMIEFKDIAGRDIGDIFIFKNITNENIEFYNMIAIIVLAGGVLVALMLGFVYRLLKKSDEKIDHQQSSLLESEQRLEQLARHSRTIAWEVDSEGRYTYMSDVAYEVLGYTKEELIGKYFYDLHPLTGREEFKQKAFEVFKRKESFSNYKNRAQGKNGVTVWLMTNGIPLIAPDGRLLGYRGNDTDITAWQKAEDAIIESRNLLNTIIDTIPIRVFWKNKSLRYMGCNTLFARDAGLEDPSELIGKDDYMMGWAEQADMYRADDRAVMESKEAKLFYEEEQTTPDGGKIWLSTSKVPLQDSTGKVLGILGVYEDITRQKEMQESLRLTAEMLNEAQRFARMGSWKLDLLNHKLLWSDEVYRIFELDPTEFKASYEAFVEHIHPEDRDMVNSAYMSSLASQQPYEVTHRLLMKDGRIKWVHESGASEFDEKKRPLRSFGTVQDITERKLAEEEIERLAFFDSLTQLPNRTLFIDRLKQAQVQSARNKQFYALLFIDLDQFKTLNDTLGHVMGDLLLQQSSQRLIQSIREGDSVARLGGDEFVVLLNTLGSDEKHAASACETVGKKILAELANPYILDGISYQSSGSMGITLFRGEEVSDDELMKQADLAMYKSKELGRNTLSFFDPKMESSLRERSRLEEEIRRGIEEEQFILYYQPQVDDNGAVYGAEALVRWNHPQRGMVSPAEFIPIAEESGLIVPLGEWIIKAACAQIRSWSDKEFFRDLSLSVNVSARQFNQSNFIETLLGTIDEYAIDPKALKLELTESLLVQNIEEVIVKMEQLKNHGIRFSLDDFGTGYSSLSYLKRLPLDQLKIDQGFVRDILIDNNDAIICKSTIALAQSMGLSVIAEGVETAQQLEVLRSFGCRAYQGYYFSRPLDIKAFEHYCHG